MPRVCGAGADGRTRAMTVDQTRRKGPDMLTALIESEVKAIAADAPARAIVDGEVCRGCASVAAMDYFETDTRWLALFDRLDCDTSLYVDGVVHPAFPYMDLAEAHIDELLGGAA